MIASMPGHIQAGQVSDEPVSGIDFYPTICAFWELVPADPSMVDGNDLSPVLFDATSLGDRNLFWTFPTYLNPKDPAKCPRTAMRRGSWKLIHRYEDNAFELYNLDSDIGERKDLSTSRPAILKTMKHELEKCYDRFGAAKTLLPNPDYQN
jgi:arylsulfatase A-like enzyme